MDGIVNMSNITKYHVMSVPCLIINQDKTSFGKKNIQQILELI